MSIWAVIATGSLIFGIVGAALISCGVLARHSLCELFGDLRLGRVGAIQYRLRALLMPRYTSRRPVPRAYDRHAARAWALSHPVFYMASGSVVRELLYDFKVQTYVGCNILDPSMPDPARNPPARYGRMSRG